jgi:hypothetical protein
LVSVTNTGTGNNVLATSPTLVTPALGTPSALVLTNATGLPAAQLTGTQNIPKGTLPTGSVLQVVSATKTDTFSTTSAGSWIDVTGLSVSITPSSSSSKILVLYDTMIGPQDTGFVRIVRDSTAIKQGDAAGGRIRTTVGSLSPGGNADKSAPCAGNYLDSPASTSALTYKIQVQNYTGTLVVNRSYNDSDASYSGRGASTITVMEISA